MRITTETTTADGTPLRINATYANLEWAVFEDTGAWREDRRIGYIYYLPNREVYAASSSTNGYRQLDRGFGSFQAALDEIVRLWDLTSVAERATMGS